MKTVRDAILLGTGSASDLHTALRVRERVEQGGATVDVFQVIDELGVPLLFRPLDGLLGACVRMPEIGTGILVTTRRSLHMQRFTAAHELGHFTLQHEGSLDREIRFPGQVANRDLNEIAADAFAAELLMPKWLFKHQARLHGWTTDKLKEPVNVYQLSLRMAVSYQATCLGLLGHDILDSATAAALQKVTPKKTKQAILGNLELEDWHPHVWLLDEHDDGGTIEAGPDDVFIAALTEHGGSGYLWDTDVIAEAGFKIIGDDADGQAAKGVGGQYTRRLVLKAPGPGIHRLPLSERRPWQKAGAPLHSLTLGISTFGAENEGLPRRSRLVHEEQRVVH